MSPSGQVGDICSLRMPSWGPVPGMVSIFFLGIVVKIIESASLALSPGFCNGVLLRTVG